MISDKQRGDNVVRLTDVYYKKGPSRTSEYFSIVADRAINKHQEKVKHTDSCRCKKYNFDDDVVMYEHIEQYPQFRCYCNECLKLLERQCNSNYQSKEDQEGINHGFRFQLAGKLMVKKGIDLRA